MDSRPSSSSSRPPTSSRNSSSRSPAASNNAVSRSPATLEQASDTKQRDLAILQHQLRIHMQGMFDQGLLDDYFKQLEFLEASGTPGFVADIIQTFCRETEKIFTSLDHLLAEKRTSFPLVHNYVHKLKGSSASVGCPTIGRICNNFISFCEACDKEGY